MRMGRQVDEPQEDITSKKSVRTRRGGRGQQVKAESANTLDSRVKGLAPIAEVRTGSANQRQRRVRIVEEQKESRPQRLARATRGTVKSEISEYDDEDDSSDENDESSSEQMSESFQGKSSSSKMQESSLDKIQQDKQQQESDAEQQMHAELVNDNLGAIEQNIAKNFVKQSKRLSAVSNQPEPTTVKIQGSPKPASQSADKVSQASQHEKDSEFLFGAKKETKISEKSKKNSSEKKKLVSDFNTAEKEKTQTRQGGVMTRKKQKSQSSNYSRSQSSNAADSDDGMYDFMDGKLTKQLKQ